MECRPENVTTTNDLIEALSTEAKNIEEDALYSARGHFEAASGWTKTHYRLGLPATVLAAVGGVSALNSHGVLAGVFAIFATTLGALVTFLNPNERASRHHGAGTLFNEVRNRARVFMEIDLRTGRDPVGLVDRVKEIGARRDELNKTSPQIPRAAFERARKGIEAGEASYRTDKGNVR